MQQRLRYNVTLYRWFEGLPHKKRGTGRALAKKPEMGVQSPGRVIAWEYYAPMKKEFVKRFWGRDLPWKT